MKESISLANVTRQILCWNITLRLYVFNIASAVEKLCAARPARPSFPAIDCWPVVFTCSNNNLAQRLWPRDVNMFKCRSLCVIKGHLCSFTLYTNSSRLYSTHDWFLKGAGEFKPLKKIWAREINGWCFLLFQHRLLSKMLFTLLLQFLAVENCGFTGQHPGVNVCNICMNVKPDVAGKEQRSAVLSWINTGMKLEGTQQRTNFHQDWMLLHSGSFYKSLFVYCLSSGFDFVTKKKDVNAVLFSQQGLDVWLSHQHINVAP